MTKKQKEESSDKEVLDLIGSKPKKKTTTKSTVTKKVAEKPSKDKKEALDLLSGPKKPSKKTASAPKEAPASPAEEAPVAAESVTEAPAESTQETAGPLNIKNAMTVADLAVKLDIKPFQIIKDLMGLGIFANPTTMVEADSIEQICKLHQLPYSREKREKRDKGNGVKAVVEPVKEPAPVPVVKEKKDTLHPRIPIITVMGHVDHGKTSLLDYIRRAHVAKGEAGGITQHIGAYTVEQGDQLLTFLDTPGHAIFTEMRARGADVTDIIVLVVAADDGIMPQTREAISHAKAAGKTVIVAINKCDLPAADPLRAKTELMEEGLVPTDFGGDVECVEVSAITGDGVDDLLGLLALQSEVLELQANPKANCRASIIEARVEQGTGSSATAIVQSGTIRVGMPFICGPFAGKIRVLQNDRGERIKEAGPGMPVEVIGFAETPNVGDELVEMENEKSAKKLAAERQESLRKERLSQPKKFRMEDLMARMGEGGQKAQLKIILKGDVQGSVEAIKKAIEDIKSNKVECVFLSASAGPISESDVLLASSSEAVILGFNVKVESNAVKALKREGVQVKLYSIVYELIDQVRDAMLGLLAPETRETIIGHAKVLQVFKLNKGKAAGCMIMDGKVLRSGEARVLRGGTPVFDGKMSTLRRYQDEVEEVKYGLECGIRLGDFNEYEVDDIIECYTLEKIKQTL